MAKLRYSSTQKNDAANNTTTAARGQSGVFMNTIGFVTRTRAGAVSNGGVGGEASGTGANNDNNAAAAEAKDKAKRAVAEEKEEKQIQDITQEKRVEERAHERAVVQQKREAEKKTTDEAGKTTGAENGDATGAGAGGTTGTGETDFKIPTAFQIPSESTTRACVETHIEKIDHASHIVA